MNLWEQWNAARRELGWPLQAGLLVLVMAIVTVGSVATIMFVTRFGWPAVVLVFVFEAAALMTLLILIDRLKRGQKRGQP